MESSFSF